MDDGAHLTPGARRIYLINCLAAIGGSLVGHPACTRRCDAIAEAVEGHLAALVGAETGALLQRCGLAPILETMR